MGARRGSRRDRHPRRRARGRRPAARQPRATTPTTVLDRRRGRRPRVRPRHRGRREPRDHGSRARRARRSRRRAPDHGRRRRAGPLHLRARARALDAVRRDRDDAPAAPAPQRRRGDRSDAAATRASTSSRTTSPKPPRSASPTRPSTTAGARRASAMDRLAYEEAVAHYERALAVLDPDQHSDDAERAELLLELGRAVFATGERARAWSVLAESRALATELGRWDLFAEPSLGAGRRAGMERSRPGRRRADGPPRARRSATSPPRTRALRAAARRPPRVGDVLPRRQRGRAAPGDDASTPSRWPAASATPTPSRTRLNLAQWGLSVAGNASERLPVSRESLALAEQAGNRYQAGHRAQLHRAQPLRARATDRGDRRTSTGSKRSRRSSGARISSGRSPSSARRSR